MAFNVPLECPRLCGLCDRYDVLKQVYGEDNLLPTKQIRKTTTTTTTTSTTMKPIGRKLKNKLRIRPRIHSTTTTPTNKSFSSTLAMYLYLIHNFILIFNQFSIM